MHLFTYGSLMFESVWRRLVRGTYASRPARLHGFARRKVRDDVYPVIFRTHDAEWVDGLVYLDLGAEDLKRLDFFEGEFYDRQSQTVVAGRETITADAYVLRDEYLHMTDHAPWDPQWFGREGLAAFLGRYKGF
ncbi:MAG: gamma-glutamylcyclotransferase family protein [Sedimentisphaerales bacterium]|jgi:gamma-glutamylcyclotransferase (GGCT)/AIG2-like uncharacterized protein YtfP|nr:gamma-glutamylcyclotransferase family protein [Sedimentisphaerales bacterium]NLT75767.1 gamma-glutamylcyclotransferase [Planctomycetota bacterium]